VLSSAQIELKWGCDDAGGYLFVRAVQEVLLKYNQVLLEIERMSR